MPNTSAKSRSLFEIVDIDSRVTESNSTWMRFAWKLTLRNLSSQGLAFRALIEFQDKDGFVVDDVNSDLITVDAYQTKTFTGYDLVTTAVAGTVARTNAKVRIVR